MLAATVALIGTWFAIQRPAPSDRARHTPLGAVLLSVFAVGYPVCNKLVLIALGTSGALSVWEPIQPFLALISLGLLGLVSGSAGVAAAAATKRVHQPEPETTPDRTTLCRSPTGVPRSAQAYSAPLSASLSMASVIRELSSP